MAIRWRRMNPWHSALLCGLVICVAWSTPGRAADSLTGLRACRDISDATMRLACFDREAAALPVSPATTVVAAPAVAASAAAAPPAPPGPAAPPAPPGPAAPVAAAARPAPVLDPQQQFGLPERAVAAQEVAAGTRAADATRLEAHIARVAAAADGRRVFTLDNEQVWRQLLVEGDLLAKQGDGVTISRGMFGSYWLQLKSGRGCKVTRLR